MKEFAKVLILFIWALVSVIAGASLLNAGGAFNIVVGIANIAFSGIAIYKTGNKLKI